MIFPIPEALVTLSNIFKERSSAIGKRQWINDYKIFETSSSNFSEILRNPLDIFNLWDTVSSSDKTLGKRTFAQQTVMRNAY